MSALPQQTHQLVRINARESAAQSRGHGGDPLAVPRKGLQLPRQLSFERWLSLGKRLSAVHTSSAWCLGDWLIHGEAAYSGRYKDAIEQTSLDYQTLRNYAWVARQFTLSRRREALSFGHHAEVAALPRPEQDFWLRKAESQHWSRNRLRREVRSSLLERESEDGSEQASQSPDETEQMSADPVFEKSKVVLKITVPQQQLESYEAAAETAGLTLDSWAIRVLSSAAHHEYQSSEYIDWMV